MGEEVSEALGLLGDPSPVLASPKQLRKFIAYLDHLRTAPHDREDALQLIAFMVAGAHEAKGQIFQDLWALWTSGQKTGGYFVEFGAASGVHLSNTWLLEKKMGWSGVLAEPNPRFLDSLQKHRSCTLSTKCVYARTGEELEFVGARSPEFSGLADHLPERDPNKGGADAGRFQVQTISLNDLLTEAGAPGVIDYLSADTEGSELEILSAFDFDRWDVRSISVEHNFTPAREKLYDLLTGRGYRRVFPELSWFDDWYVKD
jgi:FkbM family methyltransferase